MREVEEWFREKLVTDHDVLKDTQIGIHEIAKIVASTGAYISDFGAFFHKHTVQRKTLLDIGILRFPDIDHPFFKVTSF